MKTRLILIVSSLIWVAMVGIGLKILADHDNIPSVAATPASQWPRGSGIQLTPGRATLVMVVHPRCPCTRATMGELALIMAQCQGKLCADVLFLKPRGESDAWVKTDLWYSAAAIPGVRTFIDNQGKEARRFHAVTSGQTILFDRAGRLLFSGGITGSRGHEGDNDGRTAIVSLLRYGTAQHRRTPVFGCSIVDSNT